MRHVLSMDTTFPNSNLHWRAITDPVLQGAAYQLIIAMQIITATVLWAGFIRLLMTAHSTAFARSKDLAIAGLTLGLLLYIVGFIVIGGEWFAMWQSQIWNGQQKAFEFVAMTGIVLIIVLIPDSDTA